jgi:hypothetical protein
MPPTAPPTIAAMGVEESVVDVEESVVDVEGSVVGAEVGMDEEVAEREERGFEDEGRIEVCPGAEDVVCVSSKLSAYVSLIREGAGDHPRIDSSIEQHQRVLRRIRDGRHDERMGGVREIGL